MIFSSPIEPVYYILPLVGFIIGFFGSLIGGGGGFFFLPVLSLIVGVPMHTAVITSLVAALPVCGVGAVAYYRRGYVDTRRGVVFIVAGMLGAFGGAGLAAVLAPQTLKIAFGVYAILIAIYLAWETSRNDRRGSSREESAGVAEVKPNQNRKSSFFGFFAGMITGTFGTSGTAPVLAGLFSLNLTTKVVIGTSLLITLANTFFAVGAHFIVGRIDLTLIAFLTSGSIIGSLLGPRILTGIKTKHTENPLVRYLYAAGMVAIGILMIIARTGDL